MSIAAEANFSDLLQKPTDTIARLQGRSRLRLRRRDDEDLVVTTVARYDQEREVIAAASRMFLYLTHTDLDTAAKLALEAFPWIRFLPLGDTETFLVEFIDLLRASQEFDNFAPVWQLLVEWRHTAEVYADPELLNALRREGQDFGPVPEPTTA
jgi:hypothetical protein